MAMGSSILALLMTLMMVLSPAGAQARTDEFILRDVTVTVNGESYELGVDARLAAETDGESALMEFALETAEDKLFPVRIRMDENGLTGMLDGMSKSMRLAPAEAADVDEEQAQLMAAFKEYAESYVALLQLAQERDQAALNEEYAGILDGVVDRGEPVEDELEFEDGQKFDALHWSYTLTNDDIANLLEAILNADGEMSAALNRYFNATLALTGEELPEGGFAEFYRETAVGLEIDINEYQNEAEALQYDELLMRMETEDGLVELPVYVMHWGDTQTVDTYIDFEDTSIGVSAEMTENEEGKQILADFVVQDTSALAIEEGEAYEPEPVARPEAEAEESADDNIEDAEEPEAVEAAENDIAELEEAVGVIGGADGPTDVYVSEPVAQMLINGHFEASEGPVDENGARSFDMVYRIESFGEAEENDVSLTVACGGVVTEADGIKSTEADFTLSLSASGVDARVTGTIVNTEGGELMLTAPVEDAVDMLNGDEQEISALGQEALGILMTDAGKLMQVEGVSRLMNDFAAIESEVETEDEYDEYGEYEQDMEYQYTEAHSAAEVAEVFGRDLPLGDELGGLTLQSAEVLAGSAYLTYADPENEDRQIMVSVYESDAGNDRFRMGEDGSLTADAGDLFYIYGDEEYGYWSADWSQDGLQLSVNLGDGIPFEEINAIVAEIYAAE